MNNDELAIATPAAAPAIGGLRAIFGSVSGGSPATWEYVGQQLRDGYIEHEGEKARRESARKRDELYKGAGDKYIDAFIDTAFADDKTKQLRRDLIGWAKWNNVIGRVVREKATVYSQPATRTVGGDNDRYQRFVKRLKMDAVMRELNRMLVLHEDAWVQYRVRNTPRGREPVVDLISPACFWAVHHPRDKTMLVAIVLDQTPRVAGPVDTTALHYRVWSDAETFALDGACRVLEHTVEPWALGRMPGLLATTRPPSVKGCLLEVAPSAHLVAAHEAIWFLNLLMLKEAKSANKQSYVTGDTSAATMGQTADTETDVVLPEGVSVQSVDRGMDLAQFRETGEAVLDDAGANHGLPPGLRRQTTPTSGTEVHLRRLPLLELRVEQIPVMHDVERELAEVQAGVNGMTNAAGEVEYADGVFSAEEFRVDFGEVQPPLTQAERNANFETERRLGLTDTVEEKMQRNPDLDEEGAKRELEKHNLRETDRVAQMKTMNALNGGASSSANDNTPAENGALGQAAAAGAA